MRLAVGGRPWGTHVNLSILRPLLLAAIVLGCTWGAPATATERRVTLSPELSTTLRRGPAPVIVVLDAGTGDRIPGAAAVASAQAKVLQALPQGSYRLRQQYRRLPLLSLEIQPRALERLLADPGVRAVQLDRQRRLFDGESDALTRIADVHGFGFGGAGTRVAVVDSGINNTHVNLVDDLFAQACFRTENDCPVGPNDATDQNGHGTHVAGIISGANGVAPDAEIIALKVFTTSDTSDTNILNALDAVVANDASWQTDVVNMSLGGGNYADQASCDGDSAAYLASFATLNSMGISVFVATGNDGMTTEVSSPGCVTGAIGVGSVSDATFTATFSTCTENGQADKVTCFSNATATQGPGELVDMLAPGCEITAEWVGSTTATNTICGTSMATPTAAGVAATLLSVDPSLTPAQIEDLLETTGDLVSDYRTGVQYPRINASSAYAEVAITLPTPTGLVATPVSTTTIDLDWTDIAGEAGYEIQRATDGTWESLDTVAADVVAYSDTAAPCGLVSYRVRGVEPGGFSAFSNVASATVRACPLAPTGLAATVLATDTVRLDWTDNAADETGYRVERATGGGPWTEVATTAADAETATDAPLACGAYSYRVRAHRSALDDYSAYSNTVQATPCAPANDLIANAEAVAADATDTEAAARWATTSPDDPAPSCGYYGTPPGHSLWYVISPGADGSVVIDTTGSSVVDDDTVLAVYTGSPGALTEIACNDDISFNGGNWFSRVSVSLEQGTTYYVLVGQNWPGSLATDGSLVTAFDFGEPLPVPANDLFANAEVVASFPYGDVEPNWQYATRSAEDPVFAAYSGAGGSCSASFFPVNGTNTLWYAVTPTANGQLSVDMEGSSAQDSVIAIFTGTWPALTQVACDDEAGTGSLARVAGFPLAVGVPYFIHVARWNTTALSTAATAAVNVQFAAEPTPPVAFDLLAPADGAAHVLPDVPGAFDWAPSINAASYTLVVNDGSSDVLTVTGIATDEYTLSAGEQSLLGEGSYTWSVTAINADGSTGSGNGPFAFTVELAPPPAAFALLAPVDGTRTLLPDAPTQFDWEPAAGATSYTLLIEDAEGEVLAVEGLLTDAYTLTGGQLALLTSGERAFTWTVIAVNAVGNTAATDGPFGFTVLELPIMSDGFEDPIP